MDIVLFLMAEIKEQHKLRLEDDCSMGEVEESFTILKGRICEKLINDGCKDFSLLAKIQSS